MNEIVSDHKNSLSGYILNCLSLMKCGTNVGDESDLERIAIESDDEEDDDNVDENQYPSDQERVIEDEARYKEICIMCHMQPCCNIADSTVILDIISSCNRAFPKKEDGNQRHDMALSITQTYFSDIPDCVVKVFNEEWGS